MPTIAARSITPREAYRAVYVDFEGFQEQSPALIGEACEYDFKQTVFSEHLRGAAYAKGLTVRSIESYALALSDRLEREDRVVVGYSRAERNAFREYAGVDFGDRYRDAHKIGKRWINRLHRGAVDEWGFLDLLTFMGYEVPTHLSKGNVTSRLRSVMRGLEVHDGDYDAMTPTQKRKWTNLLNYNRIDCLGMRDLTLRAASEIAASKAVSSRSS